MGFSIPPFGGKGGQSFFVVFFLLLSFSSYSQDFTKTMSEIEKIQAAYKGEGYLSYTMKYMYSKESAPTKFLDSLSGNFKTHDSSFYGKLGKIEFLQNAKYNLAVYNQDKILMINKPVKSENKLMPLADWDSVFVAFNMDTTTITDKGNTRTLEFIFAPQANYKNFSIQYDVNTYLLKKLVFTMKQPPTDNGPGQTKQDGNIVTILFSGYNKTAFDTNIFSEAKYIVNQDGQLAATGGYGNYRLVNMLR
jgi:hypothetical protein